MAVDIPWLGIIITFLLFIQGFLMPKSKVLFFVQSLWLIILTCFNTGGGDWQGNEGYYWIASVNSNKSFLSNLYPTLVNCCRNFGMNFVLFNGIMSFIATFVILVVIYKYSENKSLVLSFWFVFPLIDNVIQKRAYYSLALVILAIPILFIRKDKNRLIQFLSFELLILLAYAIHSMYCLYLTIPFYLLLNYKWQKYVSIIGVIIGFILKNGIQSVVNTLVGTSVESKSDLYFNQLASTSSVSHTIFWASWQIFQLLIMLYINNKISNNDRNSILLSLNWWGLLLIPLYSFNPVFTRIFRAIILFNYITVADSIKIRKRRYISKSSILSISAELAFVFITFYMMDVNSDGLIKVVYPIFKNNLLLGD